MMSILSYMICLLETLALWRVCNGYGIEEYNCSALPEYYQFVCWEQNWIEFVDYPPVYLHLIFEISSVTRFFFNFKISSLRNQKINLITKLIFVGYTGSKNQVKIRKKKSSLIWNRIFLEFVIYSQIDVSKIKYR